MERKMKILVALKFIESADELMDKAMKVANRYDAKIYLLHVLNDIPHLSFYYDVYQLWEEFRDRAVKETFRHMNIYIDKLSTEYKDVEAIVEIGEPCEAILREAERLDVDLIIIGNRGLTGIKHMMHNNAGERVVKHSKRPVLSFSLEKSAENT